jgi:hypothetical protein
VLYKVLPNLWRAKNKDWTHYVKRAVKNFYRDQARQDKKSIDLFDRSVDMDRLAALNSITNPLERLIAEENLSERLKAAGL